MEEIYIEILHETIHFTGCDAANDRTTLLSYLQSIFKIDDAKHNFLLEAAKSRMSPKVLLNVEVIDANILKPTNANGCNSPFCMLSLINNNNHTNFHTTSIKEETLHPVWNEHFQIPIEKSPDDALYVELWNSDSDKTVYERIKKVKSVVKGVKKKQKDESMAISSGKSNKKLIGTVVIPLKHIPAAGIITSYNMTKKEKTKKRADIKLCLKFHYEKNTKAALEEHMYLIRNILFHEVKVPQIEPHTWNGSFSTLAEKILIQHPVQCHLPQHLTNLAQWIEFSNFHLVHPISFTNFLPLLRQIFTPLKCGMMTEEEKMLFWKAAVTLLPSCLFSIRNIQILTSSSKTIGEPSIVLRLIHQLEELEPPDNVNLFPSSLYDKYNGNQSYCDIRSAVIDTATQGPADWFHKLIEKHNILNLNDDDEEKIKAFIDIVITVMTSLRRDMDYHDLLFKEYFHFSYAETIYKFYDEKLSELIEPTISNLWKQMSLLKFNDQSENGIFDIDPLSIGSLLVELYTNLQTFYRLGSTRAEGGLGLLLPNKYHHWFEPGIIHWLYISQYKALHNIQKSIHLDNFNPDSSDTNYSSSAWDTLHTFERIKIFWKQISWPNTDDSKEFAYKVITDICECLNFYVKKTCQKVKDICNTEVVCDKELEMWCLTIKNMDYLQHKIYPIINEFGVQEIITTHETESNTTAETERLNVEVLIDKTIDEGRKQLYDEALQKILLTINQKLIESLEHADSEEKLEKLMSHIDYYMSIFQSQLDIKIFNHVLDYMWSGLYRKMNKILEINMQKEQSFFIKFHEILRNLEDFFKHLNKDINLGNLKDMQHVLQLNGMDTWELVHQYRLNQLTEQKAMSKAQQGLLTVRLQFIDDILKIEVLNARNLQPISKKGCCYPYVKIYFLPESKFTGIKQPKTRRHGNTTFPLFEETFVV